ncbi:hypothetical protein EJ110_NYTH23416 [Nymphaea thermarum]|nr:hypothetical protein EJ110_NYTH23416 [Nymphaea thermarum]
MQEFGIEAFNTTKYQKIEECTTTVVKRMRRMALPERPHMVLERPLVLEIRAAGAVPELAAVLFMGAPVTPHSEGLGALPALVWLVPVLPLVVGLKGSEILQRPRPRVVYVILATLHAAVAWQPQHGRRLRPSQRLRPSSVYGSMTPHVHLQNTNSNY